MRALIFALAVSTLSGGVATACTVAWSPPSYARALEQQVEARRTADRIVLARVVDVRLADGAQIQLFDTVTTLDESAWTGGAELVPDDMCGQRFAAGDLVLLYYQPIETKWLNEPDIPVQAGSRHRLSVKLRNNVDPQIGPLLRAAAYRLFQRAERR